MLPPLKTADADNNGDAEGYDVLAVGLPKLVGMVLAQFVVDFLEQDVVFGSFSHGVTPVIAWVR